ncbi:splicing factor 3B subunit 1 [Chaetoceros tenuissimus]|uniref:Splicing factor 3B subunit 1 n=1 Tax=Chaetoceros tenuissimus TaxID=426638 RepID=A0AAD3CYK7_9STRA|nr:splicing factor 3B subunit 1 [Chaetoceros tenuissimus]
MTEKKDENTVTDSRGGVKFGTNVAYDDAYGSTGHDNEYVSALPTLDEERKMMADDDVRAREREEMEDAGRVGGMHPSSMNSMKMSEDALDGQDYDPFKDANGGTGLVNTRIADRESDYQKRRHNRTIRDDNMSYKDAMKQASVEKERHDLIMEAKKDLLDDDGNLRTAQVDGNGIEANKPRRRRRRWDDSAGGTEDSSNGNAPITTASTDKNDSAIVSDSESLVSRRNKSRWDEDSGSSSTRRRKRWDETPVASSASAAPDATPLVTSSKWDETPLVGSGSVQATPLVGDSGVGGVPGGKKRSRWDSTPAPSAAASTAHSVTATPIGGDLGKALSLEREMETRNRPWTDVALDAILPSEGYSILPPPSSYVPLRTPGRKLLATPTPMNMTPAGFQMAVPPEDLQAEGQSINDLREAYGIPIAATAADGAAGALPFIKPEDMQYFGRLTEDVDESTLSKEEVNVRKIMALLLKIKSGTPPQRKTAMRQITDKARSFGAGPLFNQILPLLMSPTLEDQERHLLVKVIDRVLYKLDDLVRPYVHRILAVIEPLLIDEDYYARIEGREIISNLAKAAGLATMIATMRPDIDNPDEYVRNITSRAFAVVASALGVPALLPFLKAVCQSRKSWQARHTGIKIVQQIAVLTGCAVLPYLRELVEIVSNGLTDDQQKVRTITALTIAALAEAAYPYGVESFDPIIRSLWKGALEHHGKMLAAFLKAVGFVIPLMEENYASHYTRIVMPILLREFHSPDEEMKRIVLKVIKQCVSTAGVEPEYIRKEILPEFFRNFWIRRMALDRRNHNQVIETTVELANKVGCSDIVSRIVDDLKDDSEPYRRMVIETIQQVLENLGSGDIDDRLEERLIDGILYAFQEQAVDASLTGSNAFGKESQVMLDGFGTVVNALGERCKPYLKQIVGTIKWRLNNKAPSVRMQAADLIGRIAVVMKACSEDQLMGHLGVVLYEYLGEEYPEVLGSILGALRAIVNVIGMTKMTPPISDLLPRLTPILRNRHEKVQENCIDLVGRIADRGAEFVAAKEWMRICFELLEMLKAHKKSIRRAAVSTFGYIAKAIGPQDVLHTLLNNLKVQDRQMRVCTTVAIAIVAETCGPYTVLPAVMNEYRVPELNIQNGVLKALSFMFEYIGDMAKDYIYAVSPLLEDALMDRDPVHRQTGCATVKHLSLGVAGLGCEDVLLHLLNYVWPNIFEESPHVIQAVLDAVQGLMVSLGPNIILQYVLQGLYHPARRVRESYWKVYNLLYIYAADALVIGYPSCSKLEDESTENNPYTRTTLELFI